MNISCLKCKGRGYCGRKFCPHLAKLQSMSKAKGLHTKTDFFGEAPAPFVGKFGYPDVRVGLLTPPQDTEDAWEYDAPRSWAKSKYSIEKIVDFRSALLNSRFNNNVYDVSGGSRFLEIAQESGLASKPVEIELSIKGKPMFRLSSDSVSAPTGPRALMVRARATSNAKIDKKVDKVWSDTDLKAAEGLKYLFDSGYDENFLSRMLSVGTVGIGKRRRLVPTRWSITAIDDTLGKHIIDEISLKPSVDCCEAFFGSHLGNYYLVLLFPSAWQYELFETYMPDASWNTSKEMQFMTDYENHFGRRDYAADCAGGYYSVRLAILEKLREERKQAGCLAIRVITGEYAVPLGVWVTREAARNAMQNKPLSFASKELAIKYAEALLKKKFGIDASALLRQSLLLKDLSQQRRISEF